MRIGRNFRSILFSKRMLRDAKRMQKRHAVLLQTNGKNVCAVLQTNGR